MDISTMMEYLSTGGGGAASGAATGATGAGLLIGVLLLVLAWIFWFIIGIGGFVYWLVMVVDWTKRDFVNNTKKLTWGIVLAIPLLNVLILPLAFLIQTPLVLFLICGLAYYFGIKRKKEEPKKAVKVAKNTSKKKAKKK